MGIIKHRPDVTVVAPRVIETGRPFSMRAKLECSAPLPVDAITLEIVGAGVIFTTTQYGQHREEVPFVRYYAHVLSGRHELDAGRHEYEARFEIAPTLPGSYNGKGLHIQWSAKVHVDIPWWPDRRAYFDLHVASTKDPEPASQKVWVTNLEGPKGREPYAEVSLGSNVIEPGQSLVGRVALANTASNQYKGIKLALIGLEKIRGFMLDQSHENRLTRWDLTVRELQENAPIEFVLTPPESVMPGFNTRRFALEWFLEVRLDVPWAVDPKLWIPLQVRGTKGDTNERSMPLAVGSHRLAQAWQAAAAASGFNYLAGELTRDVGPARLRVRREHTKRRGARLVAEATFPNIGLGLRDVRDRIRCRDPEQSRLLAESTDEAAQACTPLTADDERITSALDDSGTRVEVLTGFAQRFEALVRAFESARAELPPPAAARDRLPAFRLAARQLGGELDVASMGVAGIRDEMPFSLRVRWDERGQLAHTVVAVRPLLPIDHRFHQRWDGNGDAEPMPDGLDAAATGAAGMTIDADSIELVFPPPQADVTDLTDLVNRLETLIAVGHRLCGRGGAYR